MRPRCLPVTARTSASLPLSFQLVAESLATSTASVYSSAAPAVAIVAGVVVSATHGSACAGAATDAPTTATTTNRIASGYHAGVGPKHHQRADLVGALRVARAGEVLRDVERRIEALAFDDVEPEQLLLGLRERAVDHERLLALADRGRGRRRHQPRDRAQPALRGQLLLNRPEP